MMAIKTGPLLPFASFHGLKDIFSGLKPLCINVEVSESFKRRTVGETGAKSRSDVGKRVIQAARTRFELSRCHDPSAVLHWNNALLSLPSPGMACRTKKSHSVVVAGW